MVYYKTIKDFYFNTKKPLVLLGMDWGQKKLGLSISDQNNSIALKYKTLIQNKNTFKELSSIIKNLSITGIVIGFPLETSGNEGKSCQNVLKFCDNLSKEIEIPIFLQDERFSTKIIANTLRSTGIKTKKIIELEDSLAAANILQTALDQINYLC